jgi:hypothetical protein
MIGDIAASGGNLSLFGKKLVAFAMIVFSPVCAVRGEEGMWTFDNPSHQAATGEISLHPD